MLTRTLTISANGFFELHVGRQILLLMYSNVLLYGMRKDENYLRKNGLLQTFTNAQKSRLIRHYILLPRTRPLLLQSSRSSTIFSHQSSHSSVLRAAIHYTYYYHIYYCVKNIIWRGNNTLLTLCITHDR